VTFTGWKALLVVAALAGFAAFRIVTVRATLDTEGRAALQAWVQGDVIRPILADTTRPLEERGRRIVEASSIGIRSLDVRGPLRNMVVRAELEPHPALPVDVERVRYYRMRYSALTGWTHHGSANVLSWYLAAF
jgi:hypothetical protein